MVSQTSAQQNVSYSVKYKETDAKTGSFTVAAEDALAVSSATIIDAEHIVVTFNKPMKTGTSGTYSAENLVNYDVMPSGSTTSLTITEAKLSSDGKEATLTLSSGAGMVQDTAYTLTIDNIVQDAQGNSLSLTSDYTVGLFFTDRTKPEVTTVISDATGGAKISFSENLAGTVPTVVINGISVPGADISINRNEVTVAKNFFDTYSDSIKKGVSYPIVIAGAEDSVLPTANKMNLYTGSFVYRGVTDASAPTLTQLTVKDDHTLLMTFSEELVDIGTNAKLTTGQKDGATDVSGVVFSALDVLKGSSTVFGGTGGTATTKDGITFELALDTNSDVIFDSTLGETSANLTVEAKGFKDLALNAGATATKSVTVVKDTTKPVVVRSSYDSTNTVFVVTFDQRLTVASLDDSKISIIDKSTGVSTAATGNVTVSDNSLIIDNAAGALNLPEGDYTVVIGAGTIKDSSIAQNSNAALTTDVTVSDISGTDVKPEVNSVTVTGDSFDVVFSKAVKADSSVSSATNVNNYKLNGVALPAGTVITYNTGTLTATVTMPDESVPTSGTKVVTISNIQDIAGNTMDTANETAAFTDTVLPKMTSAVVDSDGKIVLTFSENVDGKDNGPIVAGDSETIPLAADFLVYVNGIQDSTVTVEAGDQENQIKLVSSSVNYASGTIVIKTHPTTTVGADAAGNTLKLNDSATVTR